MNQPIGYWTSYTPGDNSYLETLQERYGARLERMNKHEKLYLICALASHLCCTASVYGTVSNEIFTVATNASCQLPVNDQEGLLEALIHQIRWSPAYVPTVHNS